MKIYLIAAQSQNRIIGRDDAIPWHARGEQGLFRRITEGHTLLMGRKTAESIGRPLPNRDMVVVSRQPDFFMQNFHVAGSLDVALQLAKSLRGDTFIAGGGQIYRQLLSVAEGVHLTTIEKEVEGDVRFPRLPEDEFKCEKKQVFTTNVTYTYRHFKRRSKGGSRHAV